MHVANSLAKFIADEPFDILISVFGNIVGNLPKGEVVATAVPNNLDMVTLGSEIGNQIATCLIIVTEGAPKTSSTETVVYSSLAGATGTEEVDWKFQIDLRHLTDEDLKQDIYHMMSRHKSMWGGHLGEISVTFHTIGLLPGTRPKIQNPYRAGLKTEKLLPRTFRNNSMPESSSLQQVNRLAWWYLMLRRMAYSGSVWTSDA